MNNERLMQAARAVFARQGLSATLEDIAQHAGVGIGTVYRNFSSKRQIVETLYDEVLESVLREVRPALELDDPWLAIQGFFEIAAARQARDRGLCETLIGIDGFGLSEHAAADLVTMLAPVFERARSAGVLREGVSPTDIGPIFVMLDRLYGMSDVHPELWRRYLALLLDGLRARDRDPLPVSALDDASLAAALATVD